MKLFAILLAATISTVAAAEALAPAPETQAAVPAIQPAAFIRKLQAGEKVTVVTLGTSLTGGTWRWVDRMKEWLDQKWPKQATVHNLGVGASASQTVPAMKGNPYTENHCGLDRIPEAIKLKPDVVLIEFSVNDAYLPYGISLEQSKKNLNTMIDQLLAAKPDTEIIVQTMNCVINEHAKARPDLDAYVQGYREVAAKRGLRVVDHYPNWQKLLRENPQEFKRLVPDGIHPQAAGYSKILLPELQRALTGKAE
jgi:lysophospholipase L1-like esterase